MNDIMYPLLDNPTIEPTEIHIATPHSGDTRYFTVYDENDKAIEGLITIIEEGPSTRMASNNIGSLKFDLQINDTHYTFQQSSTKV